MLPWILAAPWLLLPLVIIIRGRNSRFLADMNSEPPSPPPRVSVIVPARNEARNVEPCLRSILSTTYPNTEVILVDDHSTDVTGEIARRIAGTDPRLTVIEPPPLPGDWFGKQWACASGAAIANGEIFLFADADTRHAPDLLTRAVNALLSRNTDLLSIVGRQETGSFWERLVQPQIFSLLAFRFGGTESIARSRRASDKIANGQCLIIKRASYDRIGGHAAVRDNVAEDLMLAQRVHAAGMQVDAIVGLDQLSTRMYESLREVIDGWSKNVYAGGRHSVPGGAAGRFFAPALLFGPVVFALLPPVIVLLSLLGIVGGVVATAAWIAAIGTLLFWLFGYAVADVPSWYGFLYPLGSLTLGYIFARALARGSRVEWKGRQYIST